MAFCDFCPCEQCRTGNTGVQGYAVNHAQTEDGKWICDSCFLYDVCVRKQRAAGEPVDPCRDKLCSHRPRIVSEWSE